MFFFIETVIGLGLAVFFGARLFGKDGKGEQFASRWFFNPLKKILPERLMQAAENRLAVVIAFLVGIWMFIPAPLVMDRGPIFILIATFIFATMYARKPERITHDIEGEAVDLTPGLAPAKEHDEPVVANNDKKKVA